MLTAEEANKMTTNYLFAEQLNNVVASVLRTIEDTVSKTCTYGKYNAVIGFCLNLDSPEHRKFVQAEVTKTLDSLGYKSHWKTLYEMVSNAFYGVEYTFDNDIDSHAVDEILSVSWEDNK